MKTIFWGATGHCKVLYECIQHAGHELIALFDNNPTVPSPFPGIPIYYKPNGFENWWQETGSRIQELRCVVAIGGSRGQDRLDIQRFLEDRGIRPLSTVHPAAFLAANVRLGKGSQILAQSAVCVDCRLGEACIVNTGATVDHDNVLEDGVHIAPGAHLAGEVHIGENTMIGTGAVVLPRIRVGKNAIIGAGTVVTKDVPDHSVVFGNPGKVIRENR